MLLRFDCDLKAVEVTVQTCSKVFLPGARKVSPVAEHVFVTVLSLPPRRSVMLPRSARAMPCCLRPVPGSSASGSKFCFEATCGLLSLLG